MTSQTSTRARLGALISLAALLVTVAGARADAAPVFAPAVKLTGAGGGTEPQLTIGPDGKRWAITSSASGAALVYSSTDPTGKIWTPTAGTLTKQTVPTIDVDIVVTHTGRVIATELDEAGVNLRVAYSDDNGATWTPSAGPTLADQDRQWFAVGPDNAITGLPTVYLLYHNLATGAVEHNMWVMTSIDNGATFGPPVPIALPGTQAHLDLQCTDSGGPDALTINPKTGRLYALWGTRSSIIPGTNVNAGGCGAAAFDTPEVNIVSPSRLWVATSPDGSPGSWTTSLAVDDSATNQIVEMQGASLTLDSEGTPYVLFPESPRAYPDYSGAPLKLTWADPLLTNWAAPTTIVPANAAGNILPNVIAGAPGQLDIAWYRGEGSGDAHDKWYARAAQVFGAKSATPQLVNETDLSPIDAQGNRIAAYGGTAGALMGTCDTGPEGGVKSGVLCTRSTDVWNVALDTACNLIVAFPSDQAQGGGKSATWIATQTGGTTIC